MIYKSSLTHRLVGVTKTVDSGVTSHGTQSSSPNLILVLYYVSIIYAYIICI